MTNENPSNIGPKESASILAHQLNAFIMRASKYEGPDATIDTAESEQIISHYENLKGILNNQGFQEKVDKLIQNAREAATRGFLHERSRTLEKFGFEPIPEPDPTTLNQQIDSFPAPWADVARTVAYTEMLFQRQVDREIFALADQILRPE